MVADSKRIRFVDFLRAFAMLYVVAIHHVDDYAHHLFSCKLDEVLTYSLLGMFVFLSGYLLALGNSINSSSDIRVFFKKRFLRIYPLYLFSLILFALFFPDKLSFLSLLQHSLFLNMLTGKSVFTLWFVTMICLYYLLFPVLSYKYTWWKACLISLLLYVSLAVAHVVWQIIDTRLFVYLPLFTLSVVVSRQNLLGLLQQRKVLFVSFLLCVGGALVFFVVEGSKLNYIVQPFFMVCSLPLLLWFGQKGSALTSASWYQGIAYSSFCMYLLHRVIYHLLLKLYSPSGDVAIVCYLILFGVPLVYLVSKSVQTLYDFFCNHLKCSRGLGG